MPALQIKSIDFSVPIESLDPGAGECDVRVELADGRVSSFKAATFDRPAAWMKAAKLDYWFSEPVLYVRRLEAEIVRAAVQAMAEELGGYWLRYYHSIPGAPSVRGVKEIRLDHGVVETTLRDGRRFSILAAEPGAWRKELERLGLRFYYGPLILFLAKIDLAPARRAVQRMAKTDEQLFCRYDTPRKTLPEVLDAFRATHSRL